MPNVSHINIIGYNPSVSTTASNVWSGGATSYVQLTAGVAMEAVSASGNDTAAGTGARTIRVDGLLGSSGNEYVPFSETVTLAGATPVALTNTNVIAVNRTTVLTTGSGKVNAGKIDVRAVSGAAVKSSIQALAEASGISSDFVFTIPASRYGLLKKVQFYARTNTGDIWAYLKTYNSSGVGFIQAVGQHSLNGAGYGTGHIVMDFGEGLYIPEKTLVTLIVDVSAGTPLASAIGNLELHAS